MIVACTKMPFTLGCVSGSKICKKHFIKNIFMKLGGQMDFHERRKLFPIGGDPDQSWCPGIFLMEVF